MSSRLAISCALLFLAWASASCRGAARAGTPQLVTYSSIDKAWAHSTGRGAIVAVVDWQFDLRRGARDKYVFPTSVVPGEEIGAMKPWHGEWMAEIVHRVAPDAKVLPINARSLKERGYQQYLVRGIRIAADRGAVAVTSSMGPTDQSPALVEAIEYAAARGTIFVDVHPERISQPGQPNRPCRAGECDARIVHAGIVSVPEHPAKPDDARDVYTWAYDLEPHYKDGWGYSNGPPVIGGVLALMKSVNAALTPADLKRLIVETADVRDGFRVVNAEAAVKAALTVPSQPASRPR